MLNGLSIATFPSETIETLPEYVSFTLVPSTKIFPTEISFGPTGKSKPTTTASV